MENNDKDYQENFDYLLETYGDRTGIEYSINEIFLNSYFENYKKISMKEYFEIGESIINNWAPKLTCLLKNKNEKILFILEGDKKNHSVTLRFHVFRHGQAIFGKLKDIDNFSEPFGYILF